MTVFAGLTSSTVDILAYYVGDDTAAVKAYQRDATVLALTDELATGILDNMFNLVAGPGKGSFVVGNVEIGLFEDMGQPDFFEDYHVIPRLFEFGNILSDQSSALDVFSGFRRTVGSWTGFTNNAGDGTSLSGNPTLPADMFPLAGYAMTLEVSTNGTPSVDDTLDFIFDSGGSTISVPITLNRIVLFPIKPELPYIEKLQFLTDIIRHEDAGEQRIAVRKNPRQIFEWDVRLDDDTFDNSRLSTLMFDWQSRSWGVPMWHEGTTLTVAATAGDSTITVGSTDDADYRVGGLVLVYQDTSTFDVQTIDSFTSTTITIRDVLINSFVIGTEVTPLRTGVMQREVAGSNWTSGDRNTKIRFRIQDNDANLADTSAWPTFDSKVLVDTCNVMRGTTKSFQLIQDVTVLDNRSGLTFQDSAWDNQLRGYPLVLRAGSRSELWDIRQLLHALRGRQTSFFVPSFLRDLLPDTGLTSGSLDLNIVNIGYVQFIRNRQPKNRIWIKLTDGTTLTRTITNSVVVDPTRETLTVDSTWPSTVAIGDIEKISYLEEVRYDTDTIEIRYNLGERQVHVSAPVRTLID